MKYRIIEREVGWKTQKNFIIQMKYKFWPFWVEFSRFGYNTFDDAKSAIEKWQKVKNTKDIIHEI